MHDSLRPAAIAAARLATPQELPGAALERAPAPYIELSTVRWQY